MRPKILLLLPALSLLSFFTSCNEDAITMYIDKPEYMKKEKSVVFYGAEAKKNCELYRKLYAGMCDATTQPFVTCFDLNDKKYALTSCER